MFGMFGDSKIKAACLGDTLGPMKTYSGIDLNDLAGSENFDLQEEAFSFLTTAVGKQKSYHSFEMICATWMALISSTRTNSRHSFSSRTEALEQGFRAYLQDYVDITTRNGMPRGLFAAIENYF
jgi:hypothetical protein